MQLLYGTGDKGYQIVFLAEAYTALRETFTDSNTNFVQNAKNYIRSLLGMPDIAANIDFDAYTLFFPSQQAGLDVVDKTDVKLIDKNTLFDVAWLTNKNQPTAKVGISLAVSTSRRYCQNLSYF